MRRYHVSDSVVGPPQYLGGVGRFDVFYWASDYKGRERLIVKWADYNGAFYYWDFANKCWKNCYSEHLDKDKMTKDESETILAMYQCFAIKPEWKTDAKV